MISEKKRQGMFVKNMGAELGVHPKTVRRSGAAASRRRGRSVVAASSTPYRARVDALLGEGIWNAEVIVRRIQAAGYDDRRPVVRLYIQPKRSLRPAGGIVRYETPPGAAAAPLG